MKKLTLCIVIGAAFAFVMSSCDPPDEPRGPVELFCTINGKDSFISESFHDISRPNKHKAPFAWEMTGDGLTGWVWVYHQREGEACVVRESARAGA